MSDLPRRILELERRLRALEFGPQLGYSSIEDGSIPTYDADGNLISIIGKQPDGSHTVSVVRAPLPLQPTDPQCTTEGPTIYVAWDGNLIGPNGAVDAELPLYATDQACEIHIGDSESYVPEFTTYAGELPRKGGTLAVQALAGVKWVRLQMRAQDGRKGPPSPAVPVTVTGLVDPDEIAQLLVDLADAEARVDEARQRLDELDETTLPQLDQKIDTAKGRLDSAFGLDTVFNVTQALEDSASATLTTAALDAQAKANAAKAAAEQAAAAHAELVASGAETAAIEAAEAYADARKAEAVSAAQAAATAAETAAKAHADTKAGAAETAAISAAQTYADQKKQEALTEAAATAQSKADAAAAAAQQAAEQYAALQASGASAAALEDAQEYADTKKQEAITAANQAASAAQAAAIAAAATDATQKAAAAETAAKNAAAADATAKANAAKTAAETAAATYADLVAAGAEQAAIDAAAADATSKANAAKTAAETAAAAYADAKKTEAINAAATTAQIKADAAKAAAEAAAATYADNKVAPVSTKLNTAFPGAAFNVDAQITSKASAAQTAAINAAATDATAKANTAKSEAITAAASDAQTKANAAKAAAEAAAKTYADLVAAGAETAAIDAAAADAASKAEAARLAAITAAAADAQAKATAAENAAKAAAAADATTKAAAVENRALSRGTDLVTNGTGYLGDNTNFSWATVNPDAPVGAKVAFDLPYQGSGSYPTDELIPIDVNKNYLHSVQLKQRGSDTTRVYAMLMFYDADGLSVSSTHFMFIPGTLTKLAQPLNPGDTVVHLEEISPNWYGQAGKPAGGSNHFRRLHFWDYVDGQGKQWPPETYTRNSSGSDAWADGAVNPTAKTITLNAPWNGPAKPAGTWLSNGSAGGTYPYMPGASNIITPTEWTTFSAEFKGGVLRQTSPTGNGPGYTVGFPPGTAAIKPAFMTLGVQTGAQHSVAAISFSDAAAAQLAASTADQKATTANAKAVTADTKATNAASAAATADGKAVAAQSAAATADGKAVAAQSAAATADGKAVAAQNTANQAVTAAATAQTKADAAMLSADGKNAITYTDVAAPGPGAAPTTAFGSGRRQFDVHRNRNATTGEVYAEWLWTGAAWVPVNFGDAMLRSLDVGKITGGSAAFNDFVANNIVGRVATLIELNASRITSGTIAAARLDVSALAASMATIIQLDASRITAGTINVARLNVAELAPLLSITANQITGGTISAVVTVSGTIQTAASGARVVINGSGLTHYDANGVIDLQATSSGLQMRGRLDALLANGQGVSVLPEPAAGEYSGGIVEFTPGTTWNLKPAIRQMLPGTGYSFGLVMMSGRPLSTADQANIYLRSAQSSASMSRIDLVGGWILVGGSATQQITIGYDGASDYLTELGHKTVKINNTASTSASLEVDRSIVLLGRANGTGTVTVRNALAVTGPTDTTGLLTIGSGGLSIDGARADGAWTAYTPSWLGTATNPGTHTRVGRYKIIGKTCFFSIQVTLGTNGIGSGNYMFTLPVNAVTTRDQTVNCLITVAGSGDIGGFGKIEGTAPDRVNRIYLVNQTRAASWFSAFSNSFPTSLPSGSTIIIDGHYEIA